MKKSLIIALAIMAGAFCSTAQAGKKKDKKKKQEKTECCVAPVVLTNNHDTLSYADSRRFGYFFLEAVNQQNAGHYAAAFDLLNHCLDINPNAAEVYFMRSRYYGSLHKDSLALRDLETAARLQPSSISKFL